MNRKITLILFVLIILFQILPTSVHAQIWNFYPRYNQLPFYYTQPAYIGWPIWNSPSRSMRFTSSGWPIYSPLQSWPSYSQQIPPLPWSWQPGSAFPGIGQVPFYNWPQQTYFPSLGSNQTYSSWPSYTPLAGPIVAMQLTLIHTGDIHGHLIPRAHLRSDGTGAMRGGLARMYTKLLEIRRRNPASLFIVCGDTIQGSAEALFTEGRAVVNILNEFNIDAFAPGNWDYLYGAEVFRDLFAYPDPIAPWNALAANLYYNNETLGTSQRVLQPYKIKYINGIKVGILGFTTHFLPNVLPTASTTGREFRFTEGDAELAEFIPLLREVERVDLLVMISELGLPRNIHLAETHPGIDVILSSDLHEETRNAVVTSTGTIIVEEGTDGTIVGELNLTIDRGHISYWNFTQHIIDSIIPENWEIAARIAQVRAPFVSGASFYSHVNPLNGTLLKMPIDTIVGNVAVGLHRSNFSHEPMPAVIEGSSHDFLTDAFRTIAQTDIGDMQGFRYGTHVPPGPIKLEDIYHFIPFGPFIARGEVTGSQLKLIIENSTDSTLNPDVTQQGGGWLWAWSGLTYDLNPYAPIGQRAQNIMIHRLSTNVPEPLNPNLIYTLASFYFFQEPDRVNRLPANNIQVITGIDGNPIDATEVVVEYLKTNIARPVLNRIRLLQPLPPYRYTNPEVQPLWGAQP